MAIQLKSAYRLFAAIALASAPFIVSHAHGEFEGVGDLSEHMDDYAREVSEMSDSAHAIADDYASGEDVTGRVDELVGMWEEVELHEAIETEAMTLYPPIWVALGEIENSVSESQDAAAVRSAADMLTMRLHEALGALKYVAAQPKPDDATASNESHGQHANEASDGDTIAIIKDNLDTVLKHYQAGETETAKKLVFQTYMQRFEGIEGDLIEQDADLVTALEKDFNANLPRVLGQSEASDAVSDQIDTMKEKLDRADTLLQQAAENKSSVF